MLRLRRLGFQVKEDGAVAMRPEYPSNLTDRQWQIISRLLPKAARRGRKPIDRRLILDAIMYVVRTGCQWRQLPNDFPPWKTVYTVFWRWRLVCALDLEHVLSAGLDYRAMRASWS
jgi:transposase